MALDVLLQEGRQDDETGARIRLGGSGSALPVDGLLELHTRGRIQEIFGTDGPERIDRTRKLFNTYATLWDDDHSINPQAISAKILTRQFTNANPEVLEEVFGLLGVKDFASRLDDHVNQAILDRKDTTTSLRASLKLTEIVERRNKITHGDKTEKLTSLEVETYLELLRDVADYVASVLKERISYCCSLR